MGRRHLPTRWIAGVAAAVLLLVVAGGALFFNGGDNQEVSVTGRDFPMTLDGHRDFELALINGEIDPTDEDFAQRFSSEFLAAIPAEQIRRTSDALKSDRPWKVLKEVERRDKALAVQLAGGGGQQARLTVMTGDGGKVSASTILMAVPCAEAVSADAPLDPALASQLEWVKGILTSSEPSETELREHLAPSFLEEIPPYRFSLALTQLRALGPYTYRHHEGEPQPTQLTMRVGVRSGEEARLSLTIEPQAPNRITGLSILTQQPCRLEPSS